MTHQKIIAPEFPFASQFISVNGSKIHYVDEGQGEVILFLHGIPTSNYLWRNIIPVLTPHARCIAPDLIGMGKSDKPDLPYRVFDYIHYLAGFIDALKLKNITLVMHAWGSVIGFDYAMRHEKNIKALAFYEGYAHLAFSWDSLALPVQELAALLRDRKASYQAIIHDNYIVKKLLPRGGLRRFTETELAYYQAPFTTLESRKLLWQYVQDLPLGESAPQDVIDLMTNYSKRLEHSQAPKLLLYAVPGFITPIASVHWCRDHLPRLTLVDLGEALHFAQESRPKEFAEALKNWYLSIR